MLSVLYDGTGAQVADGRFTVKGVQRLLHHAPSRERIMLLGHGSDCGLFYRDCDSDECFGGIAVGHQHAFYLRRHMGSIIGIWCHADMFARKEGLHGLFSGMIVSDEGEARGCGIAAAQHDILASCTAMFGKLRRLLDAGVPLHEIPYRMKALDDEHTQLSAFNYGNFCYL